MFNKNNGNKKCDQCKKEKPKSDFNELYQIGLDSTCKDCVNKNKNKKGKKKKFKLF